MSGQDSGEHRRPRELRLYAVGYGFAALLTAVGFVAVMFDLTGPDTIDWLIGGLALTQIAVHFRFFLHIDLQKSHRDDLQLILFTALILLLMVGGTLWILTSQFARM